MKKMVSVLAAVLLLALTLLAPAASAAVTVKDGYDYTRFAGKGVTLNVYNWGLYISDGSDDSMNVIKEFEDLTGITVNYTTYDTNENLYSKLKSGGASYDVVFPSDYMIGRMVDEGMLEELDYTNIPNYSMIGDAYKGLSYDPDQKYTVAYTWGTVGIIYNTKLVDGPVTSWNALWDSKYAGKILMFNNSRDAFAVAELKLGLSLNPTTREEIDSARDALKEQKGLVQAYVMDEIFDKMVGGEAALAPYYAGDAITMIGLNPDLAFAVPKEGTNLFVDAMCIPKGSQNKEAAEMFINFMCETEVAAANVEFIGYSTPQTEAMKALDPELRNNPIAYPDEAVLKNTQVFQTLSSDMNQAMDDAWSQVRSYDVNGSSNYLIPAGLLVVVLAAALVLWRRSVKKKRDNY